MSLSRFGFVACLGLGAASFTGCSSLSRRLDIDRNGLPDAWEQLHFGTVGVDPDDDPDGDHLSNAEEFKRGSDPKDYFNGVLPRMVSLVPPDGSLGPSASLAILVTDQQGVPLDNAPVTCKATQGGHKFAATPDGPTVDEVTVRSNARGVATVYIRPGNAPMNRPTPAPGLKQ